MAALLEVEFADGTKKEIRPGGYSQIAAKRYLGVEAIRADDPEAILFMVYVEIHGAKVAKDATVADTHGMTAFDRWLQTVIDISIVQPNGDEPTADPTPAASSEPSPDSPPTSE